VPAIRFAASTADTTTILAKESGDGSTRPVRPVSIVALNPTASCMLRLCNGFGSFGRIVQGIALVWPGRFISWGLVDRGREGAG